MKAVASSNCHVGNGARDDWSKFEVSRKRRRVLTTMQSGLLEWLVSSKTSAGGWMAGSSGHKLNILARKHASISPPTVPTRPRHPRVDGVGV